MKTYGLFIDGAERDAQAGATFAVLNPDNATTIAHAARAQAADVDAAVRSAARAFPAWANLAPTERERVLLRAAYLIEAQRERFLELLIDESGSTITKAGYEINFAPQMLRAAAGEARRLYGETMPHDRATRLSFVIREPVGVVAALVPFNAPLILLIKMTAFPLAAGNTLVVKPSEETPLCAIEFAQLLIEAGLPAGAFNVVTGYGDECGAPLAEHPLLNGIALTGSTATGKRVGAIGMQRMLAMQLELGGKNPLIVLGDVDPTAAARAVCEGAFTHAGQICMSSSRVYVERSIADEFKAALIQQAEALHLGELRDARTAYGPVINERALQKVQTHVADAIAHGATLLTGGAIVRGLVYQPTVLLEPPDDCALSCEETFGPVVSVHIVNDLDEAIARANASDYGLSGAILTHNIQKGFRAARQLRCGSVHVGMHSFQSNALAPIGGYGLSGIGRSGGKYSVEAFTELKWISVEVGTLPIAD